MRCHPRDQKHMTKEDKSTRPLPVRQGLKLPKAAQAGMRGCLGRCPSQLPKMRRLFNGPSAEGGESKPNIEHFNCLN